MNSNWYWHRMLQYGASLPKFFEHAKPGIKIILKTLNSLYCSNAARRSGTGAVLLPAFHTAGIGASSCAALHFSGTGTTSYSVRSDSSIISLLFWHHSSPTLWRAASQVNGTAGCNVGSDAQMLFFCFIHHFHAIYPYYPLLIIKNIHIISIICNIFYL